MEFISSHIRLDVGFNWLSSLANMRLDLLIELNPRPPFWKGSVPVIWSNVKLRLLRFTPLSVKLVLILILSTFKVVVKRS